MGTSFSLVFLVWLTNINYKGILTKPACILLQHVYVYMYKSRTKLHAAGDDGDNFVIGGVKAIIERGKKYKKMTDKAEKGSWIQFEKLKNNNCASNTCFVQFYLTLKQIYR